MGNIGLYFEGLFALLIQVAGGCIIAGSFFALLYNLFLFGILFVVGLGIFLYGKAKRFDFQRQSGSIIHRGDW